MGSKCCKGGPDEDAVERQRRQKNSQKSEPTQMGEWIDNLWYMHITDYSSAIKSVDLKGRG
ncbi:hypothetical protein G5576_105368 [Homo sapiens]|uniref:IQ motif containing F3 n=1 Tax=Homo sapiens TaxID=9606 RepID=A0A590UJG8_HUMAN|nr:hypothetical protein KI723_030584 [Homo sapiens]KAI4029926.1 hypothetical protein G5576_105368 [Homo sapiens]